MSKAPAHHQQKAGLKSQQRLCRASIDLLGIPEADHGTAFSPEPPLVCKTVDTTRKTFWKMYFLAVLHEKINISMVNMTLEPEDG